MNARGLVFSIVGFLAPLEAAPVAAQVTWEAGFKGGLGLGKLTGDTGFYASVTDGFNVFDFAGDINDFRTGFAGGGFAMARINDSFGIRFEVLYAPKGGKGAVSFAVNGAPAGTADVTYMLNYFEIPILAVGSFAAGNTSKVTVFGGPAVAFKAGANVKAEAEGQSDEQDISDAVEGTAFGFTAGAGLAFAASPAVSIVIDGRYTVGLSETFNSGENIKNGSLVFMAGLSFPMGGSAASR